MLALLEPRRNVSLLLQYTPYIDVVFALDVEDQIRKTFERPEPQPGQIEFAGVARRSGARMPGDMPQCRFECIDQAQCKIHAPFAAIVRRRFFDVALGKTPKAGRAARLVQVTIPKASAPTSKAAATTPKAGATKDGTQAAILEFRLDRGST